jgi:hypothetical protein
VSVPEIRRRPLNQVTAMTMQATFESSAIYWLRRGWLVLSELRRRSTSRKELRKLDRDRMDLNFLREVGAETRKWFWQS